MVIPDKKRRRTRTHTQIDENLFVMELLFFRFFNHSLCRNQLNTIHCLIKINRKILLFFESWIFFSIFVSYMKIEKNTNGLSVYYHYRRVFLKKEKHSSNCFTATKNQCIHKKNITTLNLHATRCSLHIRFFQMYSMVKSDLSFSSSFNLTWLVGWS